MLILIITFKNITLEYTQFYLCNKAIKKMVYCLNFGFDSLLNLLPTLLNLLEKMLDLGIVTLFYLIMFQTLFSFC